MLFPFGKLEMENLFICLRSFKKLSVETFRSDITVYGKHCLEIRREEGSQLSDQKHK